MNAHDVESCIFPPSRSMRMPTLRTNTRCYLVERAWVTDTDRWLFGNSKTATRRHGEIRAVQRLNASMLQCQRMTFESCCTIARLQFQGNSPVRSWPFSFFSVNSISQLFRSTEFSMRYKPGARMLV